MSGGFFLEQSLWNLAEHLESPQHLAVRPSDSQWPTGEPLIGQAAAKN